MDEREFQDYLYKYLDGELSEEKRSLFERELQNDPLLKMQFDNEQAFDKLLRQHSVREEAPYELREAVIDLLNKTSWLKSVFSVTRIRKSAYVSAVACLIFAFVLIQVNKPFPVFAESVNAHTEYLKGSYPLEIKTNDIEEALRWFEGKVDFAVERPHLNPSKVKFVGARICHLKDKKVAYFIYEKDGHTISAFFTDIKENQIPKVVKGNVLDKKMSSIYIVRERGFSSVLCFHKAIGTGCILVSDLPEDELMSLMG